MKLWREPLVHFVVLGGLLFVVFGFVGKSVALDPGHNIEVTPGMVENLKVSYARAEGQPPEPKVLSALIDQFVREEILCREARNLGLDRDDTLVRTILVKRMEYLASGSAANSPPSDAELAEYLRSHPQEFRNTTGQLPPLGKIRDAVETAWNIQARQAALANSYAALRAQYHVVIPTAPLVSAGSP